MHRPSESLYLVRVLCHFRTRSILLFVTFWFVHCDHSRSHQEKEALKIFAVAEIMSYIDYFETAKLLRRIKIISSRDSLVYQKASRLLNQIKHYTHSSLTIHPCPPMRLLTKVLDGGIITSGDIMCLRKNRNTPISPTPGHLLVVDSDDQIIPSSLLVEILWQREKIRGLLQKNIKNTYDIKKIKLIIRISTLYKTLDLTKNKR